MGMPKIEFRTAMFRGDWDQIWSQERLLLLMEALCQVNQTHLRQMNAFHEKGLVPKPYPLLYRAGIHYEREKNGTEIWPDIPSMLAGVMGKGDHPGLWGDCVPVSSLVVGDDYNMIPIGSLKPGDRIMGDSEWTTVVEHAITGEKPILSFELNNGSFLRCSPEHRIFKSDGSEIRAEDAKVGDHLLTPRGDFPMGPEMVDPMLSSSDLAWLLGVYIADGWSDSPRHPRFLISGLDGKPKEDQKKRVEDIANRAGISSRWHEKYIAVNDKRLAQLMKSCGGHAIEKRVPSLLMSASQVEIMLEGLKADASLSTSGTVTHGTISPVLALQLRLLYRMLGKSVHIKRWDEHGGLGKNPIYRITARTKETSRSTSAKIIGIREEDPELCCDITTDSGRFYLPESDLVVHNCEDLACWRVAELRELGGIKAKPFAKWRRRDGGVYAYHALVLLPDGRIEDPSLVLGMGRERDFHNRDIANKYKSGEILPKIQFAEKPMVMAVDPESPSGFIGGIAKTLDAKVLAAAKNDPENSAYESNTIQGEHFAVDRMIGWDPGSKRFVSSDDKQEMRRLLGYAT